MLLVTLAMLAKTNNGEDMIQVDASPVIFDAFGGDVNQAGIVDGSDGALIANYASNFLSGYLSTDLNNDNFIDGSDGAIANNNASNFVGVIGP